MTDYTPTTKQVRDGYRYDPLDDYYNPVQAGAIAERKGRDFDRWLEQVKAEAWNEGHYASNTEWEHTYYGYPVSEGEICPECSAGNPYKETQA